MARTRRTEHETVGTISRPNKRISRYLGFLVGCAAAAALAACGSSGSETPPKGEVAVSSQWMNGFNVYGNSQKEGYPRAPALMKTLGSNGARAGYAVLVPQVFQFDLSATDATLNTPHYWCNDAACPDQHCEAQSPDDEGLI